MQRLPVSCHTLLESKYLTESCRVMGKDFFQGPPVSSAAYQSGKDIVTASMSEESPPDP
jgi:hypothetical protein